MKIDWTDPKSQVTEHFNVSDCLMLHKWNRLATPEDGADIQKLYSLCLVMEEIRKILGYPINVHCMYRSPEYNKLIGANPNDPHEQNLACDFDCNPKLNCDEVKIKLMSHLENLDIRMENNGNSAGWVHIDLCNIIHNRFFNP